MQSSNKNQNINKSQIHNQAKERVGEAESEVQILKSRDWYGQTSQNGKEDLEDLRFRT
jgi:hypothetical protein